MGGSDHPHSEHPMTPTGKPAPDAAGWPSHLNHDAAPEFVKFAFHGTGQFVQGGGGFGNRQGDEGFTGQAGDRAAQVRRVAVSFESVENVVQ